MGLHIQVITPSSASKLNESSILSSNISELNDSGHCVNLTDLACDPQFSFLAGTVESRSAQLRDALFANKEAPAIILCARGGYGASELLPHIDWQSLRLAQPKVLVGFSDISALHAPLCLITGWSAIHGPMPGISSSWESLGQNDVTALMKMLNSPSDRQEFALAEIKSLSKNKIIKGRLFGGCFSVLTSLLGTPFLPPFKESTILLFEDVGENPGRWLRNLTHWQQAGQLKNVAAIIWGNMAALSSEACSEELKQALSDRLHIPCYSLDSIGHTSPNWPIRIGVAAEINQSILSISGR